MIIIWFVDGSKIQSFSKQKNSPAKKAMKGFSILITFMQKKELCIAEK